MIRFGYFEQDTVLITRFYGTIDKADLLAFMDFLIINSANKQKLKKVLNDFRDAEFSFEIKDIKEIIDTRLELAKGFDNSFLVVHLIKEVKQTVYSTIFTSELPSNVANAKVCSTMAFAISYLSIDESVAEMENRILNLESQF